MLKKQLAESNKPELNIREQHLLKYSVLRPDMTLAEVKALFPEQFGNVKSVDEIQVRPGSFLDRVKKGEINLGWKDFSAWLIYQIWGNLISKRQLLSLANITNEKYILKNLNVKFLENNYAFEIKKLDPIYADARRELSSRTMKKLHIDPEFAKSHSIRSSERLKKQHRDPKYAIIRDERIKILNSSPEFINSRYEALKKLNSDPMFIKKNQENGKERMKILNADPDFVKARRDRGKIHMRKMNDDPQFVKAREEAARDVMKRLNADPEFMKRHKERGKQTMKKLHSVPGFTESCRKRMKKHYENKEFIKKHKEASRKFWSNPEKRLKMLSAFRISPNKIETNFHEYFKDKIKFTGDRQFWIKFDVRYASGDKAGKFIHKNPDFKVNGQNKVIELYGDYWHQNDDPLELMINYRNAGYKCLIFWEYDIKNHMEEVIELTNLFIDAQTEEDWKLVEEKQFEFLARAEIYLKNKKAKKQAVAAQAS